MIKKILLVLCFIFPLASCEKIANTLEDKLDKHMPETSIEQDNTAIKLYQALLEEDESLVFLIVDPKIYDQVTANIQPIFNSVESVRDLEPVDPVIIGIKKSISTQYGKVLEVIYSYRYPDGDVRMRVIFKGHDGGTSVIGFWIENKVKPINSDDKDVASSVIPEV